jgi:hypothetical protein
MSCRVAGLDVETAAISEIIRTQRERGADTASAALVNTELNLLCRELYQSCGFVEKDGRLVRPIFPLLPAPGHIRIVRKNKPDQATDPTAVLALN